MLQLYCQYQKSSSSLVALLTRGSKGGGGDGQGGGEQQNLEDRLIIYEHFIEEPDFNVELWARHAKCKMGGNGVAAFFGTIGKSGSTQQCNTKSWNWQRLILQKKFQSILTKFGSSFIGNTRVIFWGANLAEPIILDFVRLLWAHSRPIKYVPSWWLDWLSVWKRDLLVSEAMTFYTEAGSYLTIASDIDMQSLLSMFCYIMLNFTFLKAKACKTIKIQIIWINLYCP